MAEVRGRRVLLFSLASLVWLAAGLAVPSARACQCVGEPSPKQALGRSSTVFAGVVREVDGAYPVPDRGGSRLFRDLNRALICSRCRGQALDWCRRHGARRPAPQK